MPPCFSSVCSPFLANPTATLHSASVGNRYFCPALIFPSANSFFVSHAQNAFASYQLTFTTGCVSACLNPGAFPTLIHPRIRRRVRRVILHPRFPYAKRTSVPATGTNFMPSVLAMAWFGEWAGSGSWLSSHTPPTPPPQSSIESASCPPPYASQSGLTSYNVVSPGNLAHIF